MNKILTLVCVATMCCTHINTSAHNMIGKTTDISAVAPNHRMTPEALWAMGRISAATPAPDGKTIAYQVAYYSVKENKSHQVIYTITADGKQQRLLTTTADSETDAAWIADGKKLAFLSKGQLWTMDANGNNRRQLTKSDTDIEAFKFAPDESKVILIKSMPYHQSIKKNPDDLPLATGRVVTDLNYRHWDYYVETIAHPFVANVSEEGIDNGKDMLEGEPYECPMAPFGGVEQLAWSPDSKTIAYTCRKKTGVDYATSTDSDIFLYDVATGKTRNLCKPEGYKQPTVDTTKSLRHQNVNKQDNDCNVGYDTNPQFAPNGQYVAWQSMKHDGYESDRNRLCIYNLATGEKKYVTEKFDSNVDAFCWANDSKTLYFIGCWHACINMYQTDPTGNVRQITNDWMDFGSIQMLGNTGKILASRHSIEQADELYIVTPGKDTKKTRIQQLTFENKAFYDNIETGKVQERWVKTTDGKQMQVWVILPPQFDENKKYPALLFCEGGPQSPVSQFWSYRWNFQIMAANDYVVIAPNRRGLPGYGSEWNEAVSGDWTGQCMDDYLSAIDDAANNLPYVDKDRLGCVGASFGGFSAYYLAGHHNKRFKAFIAHDGAFNLESMYTDTEEAWFSNWEYDDAYWNKDKSNKAKRTYDNSPHKFVDKWDTPILCIHGEKDYRINANQGFGAFNAARLRGIPAELLIYPDENHWVLKPQNGVLWQRTFFEWLDKWLKK